MKTTREGKRFIIATFLILVAAFNTGNNLIYLILSLMLAFLFLSVLILRANMAGLVVDVTAEGPLFAGEENTLDIRLINKRKTFPCYSVRVSDGGIGMNTYFLFVPPSGSKTKKVKAVFNRRGFYDNGDVQISSSFPFILFSKTIKGSVSGNLLVYPAYHAIDDMEHDVHGQEGAGRANIMGAGEDMLFMRLFRTGDDFRKIHWKALAKSSALMVKEFSENETAKITLLIDNSTSGDRDNFEKAVSITAALARDYLEKGFFVRVISGSEVVPFGSGYEHLLGILDMLALIKEEDFDNTIGSESEEDGFTVCVLKSPHSKGADMLSSGDLVIYADSV